MKKILVLAMLILFVVSVSLPAAGQGKRHIVFAGTGVAVSNLEGLFFDIGVEKRFFGNFYGQFLFDYYLNPFKSFSPIDSYAYGLNFYGVYKIPASDRIYFCLKTGFHITSWKKEWDVTRIEIRTDYGFAGGGGIEYHLNDRAFIYSGATVKWAFDELTISDKWVKLYGGLVLLVK